MFIAFEGIDGVGKSTQIELLARYLSEIGFEVLSTREPGGTEVGEKLRSILKTDQSLGFRTELLLMLASRSQHIDAVIRPALDCGKLVITDRFEASTFAYQGYGRGIELSQLQILNDFATNKLKPDVTILIDRDYSFRLSDDDRFESAGADFTDRVRSGYLELAKDKSWITIDGNRTVEAVHKEICDHLHQLGLARGLRGRN
ncbi:MAG: dTMP kinase [Actinomycetota bacterium]|nr:dTMP kinase [Actinomycetota bacterium]